MTTHTMSSGRVKNKGFNLVELMVAMVIGTILMAGVLSVQVNGRRSFETSQSQARMHDDARFTLDVIGRDVRMAGSYSNGVTTSEIENKSGDPGALPLLGSDCAPNWYYDIELRLFGVDNNSNYIATCTSDYVADTDVLVVRYALPDAILDGQVLPDILYIRVSNDNDGLQNRKGILFNGAPVPAVPWGLNNNYLVQTHAYYVSDHTNVPGDGLPSLRRISLSPGLPATGTPVLNNEVIATGVVDFQVQYGMDTDENDSVDTYVHADRVLWNTDAREQVKTVKVQLLIRSEESVEFADNRTYSIGGRDRVLGTRNRHVALSSVFTLRNQMD